VGVHHDESTRSFARAAQLDPDCAACYWGVALTVGPNYNLPVMAAAHARKSHSMRAPSTTLPRTPPPPTAL